VAGTPVLAVEHLKVKVDGELILKDISLKVYRGEVFVLMGPNAVGKSTLVYALMGHPRYRVVSGRIILDGEDVTKLDVDERARRGLFIGFQHPPSIKGLKTGVLLERILAKRGLAGLEEVTKILKKVGLPEAMMLRDVNTGFSGGEMKRFEIAQMLALKPKIAVLDEPDSGVDFDSLRLIAEAIKEAAEAGVGVLLITHYRNILRHLKPSGVYVMLDGTIKACGDVRLIDLIERCGYECVKGAVCSLRGVNSHGR